MKYLFEKRFLIYVTIGILVLVGISAVYQMFFFKSKARDTAYAISQAYIIKEKDKISETIVDIATQHDYKNYLFKDYKGGCYLGLSNEEIIPIINDFIIFGETRILKKENDSIVSFINKQDTLSFTFTIDERNKVLSNGTLLE